MFRKILFLLSGNVALSVLTFLRTILITALISLEDFGIATTFMVSVVLTQVLSNMGLNHMIIQDNDGDREDFQKAMQGFQFLRGLIGAAALFALAGPLARFLGHPEVTWAYQVLAVIPILTGLVHFDVFRLQRRMRYGPFLWANLLPPLLSVLSVWPLSLVFDDYRIMLWAIMLQWVLQLALSHLFSERRYALSFERAIFVRGFRFGWPLFLNAALLFLIFQGERLVIGREMGMVSLALFSMAVSLVQTPMGAVGRAMQQFVLPQLSAAKNDDARFDVMALVTVQMMILIMVLLGIGVVLFGGPVVHLVLGERYVPAIEFLLALTVVETLRLVRGSMSQVGLARSFTENGLLGNLPRVLSIGLSWVVLLQGGGLGAVLAIAIAGELVGMVIELFLIVTRARVSLRPVLVSLLALGVFLASVLLASPLYGPVLDGTAGLALILGSAALTLASLGACWTYIRQRKLSGYE